MLPSYWKSTIYLFLKSNICSFGLDLLKICLIFLSIPRVYYFHLTHILMSHEYHIHVYCMSVMYLSSSDYGSDCLIHLSLLNVPVQAVSSKFKSKADSNDMLGIKAPTQVVKSGAHLFARLLVKWCL